MLFIKVRNVNAITEIKHVMTIFCLNLLSFDRVIPIFFDLLRMKDFHARVEEVGCKESEFIHSELQQQKHYREYRIRSSSCKVPKKLI